MTTLVFSTMLGISQAAKVGLGASATITLFMVAFISFAFLLWRERRTASPFIDPALFARKDYLASIVPISLQAFTQFGLLVSLPVFLIDANGIEKQVAGLLIMSMTVMMAITSPFAGRLIDRYSSRWLCPGRHTADWNRRAADVLTALASSCRSELAAIYFIPGHLWRRLWFDSIRIHGSGYSSLPQRNDRLRYRVLSHASFSYGVLRIDCLRHPVRGRCKE